MTNNNEDAKTRIRALIVDDETEACSHLQRALTSSGISLEVVGTAYNTADAERLIEELAPNVLFLDINMPGENAFQFLERTPSHSFEIVFVTAYDEFAIKALKLNAIDYILKPFCTEELAAALVKLESRIGDKERFADMLSYNSLLNERINKLIPHKITFKDNHGTEVVDFSNLFYIEAKGSYSQIVYRKKDMERTLIVSHPIAEYEEMLPADIFYRIHKSYLVNCQHIHKVVREDYSVTVADKFTLPVSRRRFADMINFIRAQAFNRVNFESK